MGWFAEKFEMFKRQSMRVMITTITAKFLFGVGLGALLAGYLQAYGWWIILLSLLMHIPAIYAVLIKKR